MNEIRDDIADLQQRQNSIKFAEISENLRAMVWPPRIKRYNHHVYRMPWSGDPRINIQRGNNGAAKAYQVKQVIAALARMEEEHGKA